MRKAMRFCVPCLFGVEGLVAQELRDMELDQVQAENGRVLFSGGWEAMVRTNLNSRFGERVLLLLGEFTARSFEELFQGVKSLPWEDFLGKEDQFPVTGSCLSSQLHSVPDCQAIVKKAVESQVSSLLVSGDRIPASHSFPHFKGPCHRAGGYQRRGSAQAGVPGAIQPGAHQGDVGRQPVPVEPPAL